MHVVRTRASRSRTSAIVAVTLSAILVLLATVQLRASAQEPVAAEVPGNAYFERTWARTDMPVAEQRVDRTWMWGPEAFTEEFFEEYAEGHNNGRAVQYFDKARMEITTDQDVDPNSPWFVTTGLLVVEMMTGEMQVGDRAFESNDPAEINVAGDPDDNDGPTYASLAGLRGEEPWDEGETITARIDREGDVTMVPSLAAYGVTAEFLVQEDGIEHRVASVFWDFMWSQGLVWENGQYVQDQLFENPFYATGLPITEAYWTEVEVDGDEQLVLLQCFERRCLTYTPSNDAGWEVEAGNVGRHYYEWRYEIIPGENETPTATATSTPTETVEPTQTTEPGRLPELRIESIQNPGTGDEHIIIRNDEWVNNVNVGGWTLSDPDGNVFTFPDLVVENGFYVTVYVCTGEDIIADDYAILYWGLCETFWDDDYVTLRDADGNVIDVYPDW